MTRIFAIAVIIAAATLIYHFTVGVTNYVNERSCYANGGTFFGPIGDPNDGGFYKCYDSNHRPFHPM